MCCEAGSHLVIYDMDVNEHARLSKCTVRHHIKQMNSVVIVVLHFTDIVRSSTMSVTHTQRAWNDPVPVVERYPLLLSVNATSEHPRPH